MEALLGALVDQCDLGQQQVLLRLHEQLLAMRRAQEFQRTRLQQLRTKAMCQTEPFTKQTSRRSH